MDAKIKANVTSFRVRYNLKDDNEAMSDGSIRKLQGDIAKFLLLPHEDDDNKIGTNELVRRCDSP